MKSTRENFNLDEITILSVHDSMKKGLITCRELVEMYIERINNYDKRNSMLNSIITINPNVLRDADKLDRVFKKDGFVGPLHGIPVLLKDNINTKNMATTGGSLSLKDVIPQEDARVARKLKDAGAIIIAKTNLHEFAVWGETVSSILGQTLNPYDLTRTPGGSSGGTGAGISANFGVIGLGTDTINSIRSPASACNLVGFRPTVGLISRNGVMPCSLTQDATGPIMRTVTDTAKVLDVISGYDRDDPATAWSTGRIPRTYTEFLNREGLKGKRIGILKSFFGNQKVHKEVNKVIYDSIEVMKTNGSTFIEIEESIDSDKLVEEINVNLHELKNDLNAYLKNLGSSSKMNSLIDVINSGKYHKQIEEELKLANSLDISTEAYNERIVQRNELKNLVMEIMAKYRLDAIVYPHQKRLVVKIGERQVDRNGALSAITGFPSCVVPAGFSSPIDTAIMGIPIGIEFLCREWDEPTLFEIAYAFEQKTKHRKMPMSLE